MSGNLTPIALRRLSLGAVALTLLLAAWKLPILKSVAGITVLEPTAVWYVSQNGNNLMSGWETNLLGSGGDQTMIEFERSDIVRFEINPRLSDGSDVVSGDTVGTLLSLATESNIKELEAELAAAEAEYSALREGSRSVDIDVAAREVEYADASLKAFSARYERSKGLYEQGFLSLEKFQEDDAEYRKLNAELQLAQSNFAAQRAGARQVDVDVASAEINRLGTLLDYARQRHELRRTIVTPIPGVFRLGDAENIILKVIRIDTLAAFISLPESMLADIKQDSQIDVTLAIDGRVVTGNFQRLIYRRTFERGCTVVGLIENRDGTLRPGMHGHGEVETSPRSLLESVNRTLRARSR